MQLWPGLKRLNRPPGDKYPTYGNLIKRALELLKSNVAITLSRQKLSAWLPFGIPGLLVVWENFFPFFSFKTAVESQQDILGVVHVDEYWRCNFFSWVEATQLDLQDEWTTVEDRFCLASLHIRHTHSPLISQAASSLTTAIWMSRHRCRPCWAFCGVAIRLLSSVDKNPCYSGTDYSGTTQSLPLKPQL